MNTLFQVLARKMAHNKACICISTIFLSGLLFLSTYHSMSQAACATPEPARPMQERVQACVFAGGQALTDASRQRIAQCLGFLHDPLYPLCRGYYQPIVTETLANPDEVQITADRVSLYGEGRSKLHGHVGVVQSGRIVSADTAYVYRDAKSKEISEVVLLGEVRVLEPGRMMIARKASIQPQDKSGTVEDVLYRFSLHNQCDPVLPVWGQAKLVQRFPNEDYLLERATYTTCAPEDRAWHIEAKTIALNHAKDTGVARDAKLFIGKYPVLYSPYLSFPTSKKRKSGFLIPTIGSSNFGGLDVALPYYWNIAPNYDATIVPHVYTRRGLMMGGEFRFLTENSVGSANARYLPSDQAYRSFLESNSLYPSSTDRWAIQLLDDSRWSNNVQLKLNVQQVSDDYFLQNFNTNLAILTERQLPREGLLAYSNEHWLLQGMVQSYQTLQPINETPVADIYQRLPQLLAVGQYDNLLFHTNVSLLSQYDNFSWPNPKISMPEGGRFHLNPILSRPFVQPWGFLKPSVQLVQNNYDVNHSNPFYNEYSLLNVRPFGRPFNHNLNPSNQLNEVNQFNNPNLNDARFSRSIPRYSLDTGLFFDRDFTIFNEPYTQTLEPRLYYLKVPFHDQTPIPVYDSAYMIFNVDQLFRNNRFSGFDRIGDTNQLSYALSSRWLSGQSGQEMASFTIGQIQYLDNRRVGLCQSVTGACEDNPYFLGYLPNWASNSPIASRALYHFNPYLLAQGDYVWNPATRGTYNSHFDLTYQPGPNRLINLGYTYLASGDITQVGITNPTIDPLHQASLGLAWPLNDRWSSLGAISYNISKKYEMMSFFGLQYDSCCWAMRLIGGRSFASLSQEALPQYNNSVYLQVQLKGLGSLGTSDPSTIIRAFLPGYHDSFHH